MGLRALSLEDVEGLLQARDLLLPALLALGVRLRLGDALRLELVVVLEHRIELFRRLPRSSFVSERKASVSFLSLFLYFTAVVLSAVSTLLSFVKASYSDWARSSAAWPSASIFEKSDSATSSIPIMPEAAPVDFWASDI